MVLVLVAMHPRQAAVVPGSVDGIRTDEAIATSRAQEVDAQARLPVPNRMSALPAPHSTRRSATLPLPSLLLLLVVVL